jgi:hypothetical protein
MVIIGTLPCRSAAQDCAAAGAQIERRGETGPVSLGRAHRLFCLLPSFAAPPARFS